MRHKLEAIAFVVLALALVYFVFGTDLMATPVEPFLGIIFLAACVALYVLYVLRGWGR